jgi:hypothetical protein
MPPTGESLTTPEQRSCVHEWTNVVGAVSPKGGRVVMCPKCNATKDLDPPVKETVKDGRPLLME